MNQSSLFASIDLGGTNIKAAIGNAEGDVLVADSVPTESHEGPEAVLDRIAILVEELSDRAGGRPAALGMGCPGLVDLEHGITRFLPNLPTQWRDVPVGDRLGARLACPVYLLNDVRMATLGELTFGLGREREGVTMVFLALGTGIGGGVAINGRLHLGPLGAAGELGHLNIQPDGPLCGCGSRGCMETLASGPAITAQGVRLMQTGLAPRLFDLTEGDAGRVSTRAMADAAAAGDANVRDAIVQAARYLGIGIACTVVTLHPDLVVLGGGVAGIGELLFDTVRETLRDRVRMMPPETVEVLPSRLGDRTGTLGGLALALKGGELSRTTGF